MSPNINQIKNDILRLHNIYISLSVEKEYTEHIYIPLAVTFKISWTGGYSPNIDVNRLEHYSEVDYYLNKNRDVLMCKENIKINDFLDEVKYEAKLLNIEWSKYLDAVENNNPISVINEIYSEFS